MPLRLKQVLPALLGAAVAMPAAVALADSMGAEGSVTELAVYSSSSTLYANRRGELKLKEQGGSNRTYYFGGQKCSHMNLSTSQVALLSTAVNNPNVNIAPTWRSGTSGTRCIVGFKMRKPTAGGPS